MRLHVCVAIVALSALPALALDPPKDIDIGVYITDGSKWMEAPVEIVNWKTGGVAKHFLTDGIIKGDLNAIIQGGSSPLELPRRTKTLEALIHTVEGVAGEEYQLVRLRIHSDSREFRSVTGGILHASGGAHRDIVPFKATHIGPRLWTVDISDLDDGEYGFLPPVNAASLAASGKIYSFRMGCDRCSVSESALDGIKNAAQSVYTKVR